MRARPPRASSEGNTRDRGRRPPGRATRASSRSRRADVPTASARGVHVRTARHPTLDGLPPHVALTTFDHIYENTKMLQDVVPPSRRSS